MSSFPFHPRRQRQRLGFSPVGKGEDSPRLLTKTAFPGGEPSSQHGCNKSIIQTCGWKSPMSSFPFHPRRQRQRLGFSPVGKGEDSPRLLTKTAFPGGEPSSQHDILGRTKLGAHNTDIPIKGLNK
ncbi:hypothetical protein Lal_00031884 [Lupinus albus]|nr:hypothetical protein Lal_00031884 [Lupinus albus]